MKYHLMFHYSLMKEWHTGIAFADGGWYGWLADGPMRGAWPMPLAPYHSSVVGIINMRSSRFHHIAPASVQVRLSVASSHLHG